MKTETKGRWGGQLAKLTEPQVQELRERYARGEGTQKALGAEYGLKQAQASEIIRRVAWSHVP
jgi:DNA-binding MarR family transcriptional regulator